VTHLSLIHANGLATIVTVLGEHGVEAEQAIGLPLPHYVTLSAQLLVALMAGKVIHVPGTSLRLGALICQDNLWAKVTSIIITKVGKAALRLSGSIGPPFEPISQKPKA